MTWPFDNDTKNIVKTIARNDITKNRNKKIFSIITISLATALLMALAMFESGYEISKDRQAASQPQVIFSEVSNQQISWLRSDEHIETIVVTDTPKGHDAQVTIIDATKMTQYGFTTVVNKIASQYNIRRVIKSELFMDSLPDGGLLNQKNAIIVVISSFVIFVSALVIYNIFYLWVKPDRDKNRYVSAGVQIYSCFRLYSGGLTCSTLHIFPFHFPHFLVCGNIHNPDIGIVNVDLLCPFPVLFLTLMDYDFIHKCV